MMSNRNTHRLIRFVGFMALACKISILSTSVFAEETLTLLGVNFDLTGDRLIIKEVRTDVSANNLTFWEPLKRRFRVNGKQCTLLASTKEMNEYKDCSGIPNLEQIVVNMPQGVLKQPQNIVSYTNYNSFAGRTANSLAESFHIKVLDMPNTIDTSADYYYLVDNFSNGTELQSLLPVWARIISGRGGYILDSGIQEKSKESGLTLITRLDLSSENHVSINNVEHIEPQSNPISTLIPTPIPSPDELTPINTDENNLPFNPNNFLFLAAAILFMFYIYITFVYMRGKSRERKRLNEINRLGNNE